MTTAVAIRAGVTVNLNDSRDDQEHTKGPNIESLRRMTPRRLIHEDPELHGWLVGSEKPNAVRWDGHTAVIDQVLILNIDGNPIYSIDRHTNANNTRQRDACCIWIKGSQENQLST